MSTQAKIVLIGVLLLLALGATVGAAAATFQAYQNFQRQNALAKAGDVVTIHSWMTIPYIAHLYHVPESYLYNSLHISNGHSLHHKTLHSLAKKYNRPVNELIHEVQTAIQTYRKTHPGGHSQVGAPATGLSDRSPPQGRRKL